MDAAAEFGRNPVRKYQIRPEYGVEYHRLTRTELPNPSRETKFSDANGDRRNIHFSCSADREQDWQPYPVDPYSCYMCDYTYIRLSKRLGGNIGCKKKEKTFHGV